MFGFKLIKLELKQKIKYVKFYLPFTETLSLRCFIGLIGVPLQSNLKTLYDL